MLMMSASYVPSVMEQAETGIWQFRSFHSAFRTETGSLIVYESPRDV